MSEIVADRCDIPQDIFKFPLVAKHVSKEIPGTVGFHQLAKLSEVSTI
jgi:hypothetical protein